MKICYLANAASIHTQRWAEYFASVGYQVVVVSLVPGNIKNVQVIHVPLFSRQRHLNILLSVPKIKRIIHDIKPDILHAHYITSYGFAAAITKFRPLVLSAWGSDVLVMPEKSVIYRHMVRYIMRRADLVTSIAEHMTNLILERNYVTAEKIRTFPFGVDTDVFNPTINRRKDPSSPPVIVSNRRLDTGLDVDVLIQAIPAVLAAHPAARFIIAGDGPLRVDLERLSERLNLSESVTFIGAVGHSDMPGFLSGSDIFISTSRTDGNNISLNEAMACGAFPIATNIDANRQWIDDGKNGLLFDVKDHKALSQKIIEAIESPEWRKSIIQDNFDIIQSRASWQNEMRKMQKLYEYTINN